MMQRYVSWSSMKAESNMAESLMPILGTVIVALLGWLVAEQRSLRSDVSDLRERMARLEDLFEGLTKREAVP